MTTFRDRVQETSTSTGTGDFTLIGAVAAHRTFASAFTVGQTTDYTIVDQRTGAWEVGEGTYSAANVLTRTTVQASSNANALVPFAAGAKNVFSTVSAVSILALAQVKATGATTARFVADVFAEEANVKAYGASGNGTTDDTAAIQAAFDSGLAVIRFPAGTYRITAALVLNRSNVMLSGNTSTINMDNAGGTLSHLIIGDNTTQRGGIRINDFIFTRSQVATAGAAIDMRYVGVVRVSHCRVFGSGRIYRGIKIDRGIQVSIEHCYLQACVADNVYLSGTGAVVNSIPYGTGNNGDRTVDVEISDSRIEGAGGTGIKTYDFCEGLFVRDCIFYNNAVSVSCSASVDAHGLASFQFFNVCFDSSAGAVCVYLDKISNVQATNCWFSNNTGINLDVTSSVNGMVVSGCQAYHAAAVSMRFAGQNMAVTGNLMSGGTNLIYNRSTAINITITGNTLIGATAHGINNLEAPDGVTIIGNTMRYNTSGNVSSGGTNVIALATANNFL